MTRGKAKSMFPNGLSVRRCGPCRLIFDQETFVCPTCHAPTVTTRIFNQPERYDASTESEVPTPNR